MKDVHESNPEKVTREEPELADAPRHDMEEYLGGTIKARHGYIPVWLLVVYFVLFAWALYYAYQYWGGLGPGRI
ncbi:hypothetical protein [Sinorhizobium fredii]|uniref:hypothetical protein n=1 Tax=Rhizobium fredii TaxID=380 RepID=UPI0004B710F4|nr:hypothetical protein [Sinorhizobium fredii]